VFDPSHFDAIEWDDEDDDDGNLVHCLRHGVTERIVGDVLWQNPVEIKLASTGADFIIVGPDRQWDDLWTLLFIVSPTRGDWLRPVTGWRASPPQKAAWERATQLTWPPKP
jgi:hypothetical protein